jgi:hypothetical protein
MRKTRYDIEKVTSVDYATPHYHAWLQGLIRSGVQVTIDDNVHWRDAERRGNHKTDLIYGRRGLWFMMIMFLYSRIQLQLGLIQRIVCWQGSIWLFDYHNLHSSIRSFTKLRVIPLFEARITDHVSLTSCICDGRLSFSLWVLVSVSIACGLFNRSVQTK